MKTNNEERKMNNPQECSLTNMPNISESKSDEIQKMTAEYEYQLLKVEANANIAGQLIHENIARLLRVIFLHDAKEKLAPKHLWTRWCQETGVDLRKADDAIEKLGKAPRDLLIKFGSFTGYNLNKIKHLTKGNFNKLIDSDDRTYILVDGKRIPLVKEEVEYVVRCIEERAAKEAAAVKRSLAERERELKNTKKELQSIRQWASTAGLSPEEIAYDDFLHETAQQFDTMIRATQWMRRAANLAIRRMMHRLEEVVRVGNGGTAEER